MAASFMDAVDITHEHKQRLIDLGITNEEAAELGITYIPAAEVSSYLGMSQLGCTGATKIEYDEDYARLRLYGTVDLKARYRARVGSGVRVYVPKCLDLAKLSDPLEPLILVEGEFKALKAALCGYQALGLGGVYNIIDKLRGDLVHELTTLPLGKVIYICFDMDTKPKTIENVGQAEDVLAALLMLRGYDVRILKLPLKADKTKWALDDQLLENPDLSALMDAAKVQAFTKDHGVAYLLSKYVMGSNGEIIDAKTLSKFNDTKFSLLESNCRHKKSLDDEEDSKKKRKPTQCWQEAPYRPTVKGITFDPNKANIITPDNYLNGWRGYRATPINAPVEPLLEYWALIGVSDPEAAVFINQIIGCLMQFPGVMQNCIVELTSQAQGIGKSFLLESIVAAMINGSPRGRRIQGELCHALVIEGSRILDSRFNGLLGNLRMCGLNELGEKNVNHSNLIKDLVTATEIVIEQKGVDSYTIPYYIQYFITSNETSSHYIDKEDRRVVGLHIDHLDDDNIYALKGFFADKQKMAWFNSQHGINAMFGHYLNLDLNGYTGQERFKQTLSTKGAILANMSDIQRWVHEDLAEVPFIIPKLEFEKFDMVRGKGKTGYKKAYATFREEFGGHKYDRTHGQIRNSGHWPTQLTQGNKSLVVLARKENRFMDEEAMIKALMQRYTGAKL